MVLRDDIETALRAWNAYEINRGSPAVIDFDCHPSPDEIQPAANRLAVHRQLRELRGQAEQTGQARLTSRLNADLAYLGALLGERPPLTEYIRATQGCHAGGWQDRYVTSRGELARQGLTALGIEWGPDTSADLNAAEGPIDTHDAPDAIRQAAEDYETAVRQVTASTASYELTIEATDLDAYWAYWVDGVGHRVRLRLNLRNATFTKVAARQFALHEILGHGLQGASWTERAAREDVPWVRLSSVHAPQQVLLEGLAQALPLFIAPDDQPLTTRVRLDHYTQLVRAELHLAINAGSSAEDCAQHARFRVPWWNDATIGDILTDRGANTQLRSYLWAYPAGIDWFTNLATADPDTRHNVLRAAYREPLTPDDLTALWPTGPTIGGSVH